MKASKAIRRSRSIRKTAPLQKIETMAQLVAALGGAKNVAEHITGDECVVLEWFERNYIRRAYGLQLVVSLMERGHTLETISAKLFDMPTWHRYIVPVPKPAKRAKRR